MNRVFVLRNDSHAQGLWAFLRSNWKACAEQGRPLSVQVSEFKSKRSLEQNKRYWALLNEIAGQAFVAGEQFSQEAWHEHFKRTFIGSEEHKLPSGAVETRGISTTTLNVSEFASYMTRVEEYAASELGVEFTV